MPRIASLRSLVCLLLTAPLGYLATTSFSNGAPTLAAAGCGKTGPTAPNCHPSGFWQPVLTLTGIPAAGWVPGATYNLTATVNSSVTGSSNSAGFTLQVSGGTLTNAPAGTTIASAGVEIHHTTPKTMTGGAASWTFTWTAPSGGQSVDFSFAGLASNGNGSADANDIWAQWTEPYFTVGAANPNLPAIVVDTAKSRKQARPFVANVYATVNPKNTTTVVTVQYGLTAAYGSIALAQPNNLNGSAPVSVVAEMQGLEANTEYHYRFIAKGNGTSTSPDFTFRTAVQVLDVPATEPVADVTLYPNPTQDVLRVQVSGPSVASSFTVLNAAGQRWRLPAAVIGSGLAQLDVAALPAGTYWLVVPEAAGPVVKAFQKN